MSTLPPRVDGVGMVDPQILEPSEFVRTHWLGLVRLAGSMTGSRQTAEDVVQDVLERMQQRWLGFQGNDDALAYVRRAVINGCRSYHRKARADARRELLRANHLPRVEHGADVPALEALEARELRAAITSLPRRQREVVVLRYLAELSVRETANVLAITEQAVKASTSRALDSIQRRLDQL